jgi:glycolate oxidase
MKLNKITLSSKDELRNHILTKKPTYYYASATSTVIPYDKIESYLNDIDGEEIFWGNLSTMPEHLELDEDGLLTVTGPVCWQDAKAFCRSKGRDIMTSPTEELASILSGLATSATGERCFGFGTLRDQVVEVEYCDQNGEFRKASSKNMIQGFDSLSDYQKNYLDFKDFKNAPFPRMEKEVDFLIGTEGQLGVITQAKIKTTELVERTFIFIKLPRWEKNMDPHLEIFEKVQSFRDEIFSCELLDENSMKALPEDEKVAKSGDVIFLEVKSNAFEDIYERLLTSLDLVNEEDIFEISANRCHQLRMNVPRYTFEKNLEMGVVKKGTDVQVNPSDFKSLLEFYRSWTELGLDYNLFGHFGDAHLHFNFLPNTSQVDECQRHLEDLYEYVAKLKGSPFAEHGIGIIKQKFITHFWSDSQYQLFRELKDKHDPSDIFFPIGYLSIKRENT